MSSTEEMSAFTAEEGRAFMMSIGKGLGAMLSGEPDGEEQFETAFEAYAKATIERESDPHHCIAMCVSGLFRGLRQEAQKAVSEMGKA